MADFIRMREIEAAAIEGRDHVFHAQHVAQDLHQTAWAFNAPVLNE